MTVELDFIAIIFIVAKLSILIGGAVGWALFFQAYASRYRVDDLVAGLRSSLKYEAIALYDEEAENPIFQFVPDRFGAILGRDDNAQVGQPHWGYWSHFKESRQDWAMVIQDVVSTGVVRSKDREQLLYPGATEPLLVDWECGPRYDAGRLWRAPKICGFYVTHRASSEQLEPTQPDEDDAVALERMRAENKRLALAAAANEKVAVANYVSKGLTSLQTRIAERAAKAIQDDAL